MTKIKHQAYYAKIIDILNSRDDIKIREEIRITYWLYYQDNLILLFKIKLKLIFNFLKGVKRYMQKKSATSSLSPGEVHVGTIIGLSLQLNL